MSKEQLHFKRIRDKLEYIIENLRELPLKPSNNLELKGIFYSIQTSIESMIDIIAMIVKELGIPVKDDSNNIDILVERLSLNNDLGIKLKRANGLRNILVHRYNGINDEIALNSVPEVKDLLYEWMNIIEGVLNDFKRTNE